jgi:hypothetical protein
VSHGKHFVINEISIKKESDSESESKSEREERMVNGVDSCES